MIFVEKYKPKKFEEIIGLDKSIPKMVKKTMPNFLFHGPAGTGKSSTALVIANNKHYIKINASDERGINTIRERVKSFASTKSMKEGKKIVILDEADGLSSDAQNSMRGVMDDYGGNCAFVLTCNFFNKIIDPIKSRCVCVEFKTPPGRFIGERLEEICVEENVEYTGEGITNIVNSTYPDIRRAIKELETIYLREGSITEETTNLLKNKVRKILLLLKKNKYKEAVGIYENDYVDEERLLVELSDDLFWSDEYSVSVKKKVMKLIRTAYVQMSRVRTKRLIIRPFLLNLKELIKGDKK